MYNGKDPEKVYTNTHSHTHTQRAKVVYYVFTDPALDLIEINITQDILGFWVDPINSPYQYIKVLLTLNPTKESSPVGTVSQFFFFFLGPHLQHMEVPRLGTELELQLLTYPQPQQCWIRSVSSTYTTAHSNAGSLTHWARPGIKYVSPWILVGIVNCWATRETLSVSLF